MMPGLSNSVDRFNGVLASLAVKVPCVAAAIVPITLSGEQTVNGVAVVSGDRVLVTAQASAVDNGIYDASASAWARAADFDGNRDVTTNTFLLVANDSTNPTLWRVTSALPIVIGSTSIDFEEYIDGGSSGGAAVTAQYRFDTATAEADPGKGDFRMDNATPASVTEIFISSTTDNNNDLDNILGFISPGDQIYIQQDNDAAKYILLDVTANVDNTGWYSLAGTVTSSGTIFDNNGKCHILILFGGGAAGSSDPGISEINTQNGNYTLVAADKGKTIRKATSTVSITHTIPANSAVPYPIGTLISERNSGSVDMSIAITTDVMTGTDGLTGTRTLGANQVALMHKVEAAAWEYSASDL